MTKNGRWREYRKTATVHAMRIQNLTDVAAAACDGARISAVNGGWKVETLEGPLAASWGDWLLRGSDGEHWPVAAKIFEASYEREVGA